MAKQLLDRSNVVPVLEQVRRERMAEGMTAGGLGYACLPNGLPNRALQDGLMEMMPAPLPALGIAVVSGCGKDPLPDPFPTRVRVFSAEGGRQFDPPGAVCNVLFVMALHDLEMAPKRLPDYPGQNGQPVAVPLAASNDDVVRPEIDVLHAKPGAFEEAEAASIEKARHEFRGPTQVRDDRAYLFTREDHRKASRAARAHEIVEPRSSTPRTLR